MLALHRILNSVWFMTESEAAMYRPYILSFLKGNTADVTSLNKNKEDIFEVQSNAVRAYPISKYAQEASPENAPEGSIAILNITGAITKYDQECGPTGTAFKSEVLKRCYANDNIKGIVLNVDSGGGEGYAMRLFAETIKLRNKPVIGFINDTACSAAYGILAGCDYIVANDKLAQIGSIGTYMTFIDDRAYYENQGFKLYDIYASASKDKNDAYRQALEGNFEPYRKLANTFNETFLEHVEQSRLNMSADRLVWGTGKVFFADEALTIGLIDHISSLDEVINSFI